MTTATANAFRELCNQQGLAVTHQRQVIWEVMQTMHGHPSPEEVFVQVKELVPAISLATVYKNIHVFLASGLLSEVSPHHGSLRIEVKSEPHHHLVCTGCRTIEDISDGQLMEFSGCRPAQRNLPGGFLAQRIAVDVLGLCARCQLHGGQAGGAQAGM